VNIQISHVSVCRFDPTEKTPDNCHVTATVNVNGQSATLQLRNVTKAEASAFVKDAGLGELRDTRRTGSSKSGKNKGIGYRIFEAGEKPGSTQLDESTVEF
jgi:hypothetical protein